MPAREVKANSGPPPIPTTVAWRSALQSSYAYAGLSNAANRYAGAVTVVVALAVLVYSRIPLGVGFDVDFRTPLGFGLTRQATLVGFSAPSREGRDAAAANASVVMNRPLPSSFVLEIEGQVVPPRVPGAIEIAIGAATYRIQLSDAPNVQHVAVQDSSGGRTISFRSADAPDSKLGIRIRRLTVR